MNECICFEVAVLRRPLEIDIGRVYLCTAKKQVYGEWTQHLESSYKVFNVHVEEERIIQEYDINICRIILQYACVCIYRERAVLIIFRPNVICS